jgi:hypothetical protein
LPIEQTALSLSNLFGVASIEILLAPFAELFTSSRMARVFDNFLNVFLIEHRTLLLIRPFGNPAALARVEKWPLSLADREGD